MRRRLIKETDRLGVRRIGRTLTTDLLKAGGQVEGAVGFNTGNGEFYILRAGAGLKNFEFFRVWNVPVQFAWES